MSLPQGGLLKGIIFFINRAPGIRDLAFVILYSVGPLCKKDFVFILMLEQGDQYRSLSVL